MWVKLESSAGLDIIKDYMARPGLKARCSSVSSRYSDKALDEVADNWSKEKSSLGISSWPSHSGQVCRA